MRAKMKKWNDFLKEQLSKDLEQEGFTMFFKKEGQYYAVKEKDRIMFAKIKTKDIKDINTDKENIQFLGRNIKTGEDETFTAKDIKDINVCEKEEIDNVLS
jgi:hypothetical protein